MLDIYRYYSILLASGIVLETAASPKPGNVHRYRDYHDLMFEDFLLTGLVASHILYKGVLRGRRIHREYKVVYGDLIHDLVSYSMKLTGGSNTCLGTSLLIIPLAIATGYLLNNKEYIDPEKVARTSTFLLKNYSTVYDSIWFYRAVRKASPSYIRSSDKTEGYPNVYSKKYIRELISGNYSLWDIVEHSSKIDIVCKELVEGYPRSLYATKYLWSRLRKHGVWNKAVVETYLKLLSMYIDTTILRKHGIDVAGYVKKKALEIATYYGEQKVWDMIESFDKELHSRGINPGSIADIIAVAISLHAIHRRNNIIRYS